jgi:hypothetical protein
MLDTITQKYADAITTAYKDLKLPEGPHHVKWPASISCGLQRRASCAVRDDPVRAETLKVNQTWTIRDALVYMLTDKALAVVYNRFLPHARQIMKSFTVA